MFWLIFGFLGVTGIFYLASATQYSGWFWSYQLCQQSGPVCDHPSWLLIATVCLLILGMLRSMSEA